MNVRVMKRDERDHRTRSVSKVPKTAEQAESEVARRTIITIKAWVDELRQKQRAESERAHRLLSEAALSGVHPRNLPICGENYRLSPPAHRLSQNPWGVYIRLLIVLAHLHSSRAASLMNSPQQAGRPAIGGGRRRMT